MVEVDSQIELRGLMIAKKWLIGIKVEWVVNAFIKNDLRVLYYKA